MKLGVICMNDNMQDTFNSFLNTLITVESCFPAQHTTKNNKTNRWITHGKRVSCRWHRN